ncbi:MAG: ABC transporter permease [Saprospirales bacterium]|nr:ABC transporter permease [Saprospirales bacterium]
MYCRIDGKSYFPGLRAFWKDPALPYGQPVLDSIQQGFLWRRFEYEFAVFAPVPFNAGERPMSPDTTLLQACPGTVHPGSERRFRHWLGTDVTGYDVAAGVISGARIAVFTGAMATGIAFAIGLTLGAFAGFWGDNRLRVRRGQIITFLLGLPFAWFYASTIRHWAVVRDGAVWSVFMPVFVFAGLAVLFFRTGKALQFIPFFSKTVLFPADLLIMRLAEVFTSVPGLVAIVAFAAMLQDQTQTLWAMTILIGAFSWPGVALFIRAELLRIREMEYITAARGMGLTEWRILYRHALPNALRPAYTILAFGVAGAILLEASLSFLGYGDAGLQGATWGSLLRNARSSPQLWWISVPPGLAICLTILALHRIGESLSERR